LEKNLSIDTIIHEAHTNSVQKGFWDKEQSFGESIALIHSELSEALEDFRAGNEPAKIWYEYKRNGETLISEQSFLSLPVNPALKPFDGTITNAETEIVAGKPCGIPSELADAIIRICDLSAYWGIDLETAIEQKMAFNRTRPRMHGKIL
jgi:NTP pyrophosphatase (non-canonical NTP hydrolase)